MRDTPPTIQTDTPFRIMFPRRYAKHFLGMALLLLVLVGLGNVHSHHCLDGQEAAVSVHFENLQGHPEHAIDEYHVDVENDLMPQAVPGKSLDHDSPLFLFAVSLLCALQRPPRQVFVVCDDVVAARSPSSLLPPLRAPPVHF